MNTKILYTALALLVVVAGVFYGGKWLFSGARKTPTEKLAQLAVAAPTPEEKVKAASQLAGSRDEEAVQHMRQVLQQLHRPSSVGHNSPAHTGPTGSQPSETPAGAQGGHEVAEVKAMMITGLAQQWDFDSMPLLLEALDDESFLVRSRAHLAIQRLLQVDVGYRPDDPPEVRRQYIQKFRDEYQKMAVLIEKFKQRQKSGEQ